MKNTILVIDDEKLQAEQLSTALKRELHNCEVIPAFEETDIINKIESVFFSVAIVDLRMDRFDIDGFSVIDKIMVINPYAKVIAVSAYTSEYISKLNEYISKNKIMAISEKDDFEQWIPKLKDIISNYFEQPKNPIAVQILEDMFSDAKNELDTYQKGKKFENFVVILFRQMGFKYIETRVKDAASNEMDLIVRNDIEDSFFSKFKRYIFVECKNKPESGFDKNDFIVFNDKVSSSAGDSDLGMVFSTGSIKRTVYQQALKESKGNVKILYMSSPEILQLIHSSNMLDELKLIIDQQVQ